MAAKDDVGREGEALARRWLTEQGSQVLDTNWRCDIGELDIVALDGDCLAFVEVKTRTSTAFGHPAESVTPAKVARLRRLAGAWAREHEVHAAGMRLDVIAILMRPGQPALLEHLPGIG